MDEIISLKQSFHKRVKLMHENGLIARWLEQEISNLTKNDTKSAIKNCYTQTWEKTRIAINDISFLQESLYKLRHLVTVFVLLLITSSVVLILEIIYAFNIRRILFRMIDTQLIRNDKYTTY